MMRGGSLTVALIISFIPAFSSLLIVPQSPGLIFTNPYAVPQFLISTGATGLGRGVVTLGSGVSLLRAKGKDFFPIRSGGNSTDSEETKLPKAVYSSRLARRTLDLCYFIGNDIHASHVACNENWADSTRAGLMQYIAELTLETNRVLGENNLRLAFKDPFERHDPQNSYPSNPSLDTLSVKNYGCDAVVFLVFNQFSADCSTSVSGHKYSGLNKGGMCEAALGSGYAIVVDQGFIGDAWTGPQILAHHLLKMLIADIHGQKTCPNKNSLLFTELYPGEQSLDKCAADLLNQSAVSLRDCMQN